ncbi:MAG: hypothetical protein GXP15_08115 [Gammaproteobacteria bacterium]|nr:hypothetical protein [Gammaproteobacteria bacterium]
MYRNAQHEESLQHRNAGAMMVRVKHRMVTAIFAIFVIATASFTVRAQSNAGLATATSDGTALNVTIPVFDPGIPTDPSVFRDLQVFPRIRQIEAKLMPFLLRETLVESAQWGAVRVVTKPEAAAELQLFGTIVRSDGDRLDLRIRAVDATGVVWLNKIFSARANDVPIADQSDKGTPEFQAIYDEIASALSAERTRKGDAAVSNIKGVSLIQYASELAPSTFNGYLEQGDDGILRLLRLPARNDPMLVRIETIRNTEFLITDTVDTKFREFNANLARTYREWRKYRRKLVDYEAENIRFAEAKADDTEAGTWKSIKHQYDSYKYARVTTQEQDRLAVAFNTEVAATVEAMETRVAELDGWVERGYLEWRGLLEELFEVEVILQEREK